MRDDMTLVREFAATQSEPAFAALVARHLALVHSAARRQVGDDHLAGEIAQAVFLILARKAATLGPKTILAAWLYRTTRYTAADALKTRRRRAAREQEAYMQSSLNQTDTDAWTQLAPVLDEALNELGETDRAALLLRYFENQSAGEVAAALRMKEAAVQKRVTRALEKLRARLVKRGVTLTATVIAGAVAANVIQAAPAGLAIKVSMVAVKGAAVATSITTLVKGAVQTMTWVKVKMIAGIGITILIAGGAISFAIESYETQQVPEDPIVFFRKAISSPPDVELFVAGQRDLRPQETLALLKQANSQETNSLGSEDLGAMRFYSGARAGANSFLRPIKDPKSPNTSDEGGFVFGRSGATAYQLTGNSISYGFGTNTFATVVDAMLGLVRQHLDMGLADIKPESVVWNGNEFSAIRDNGDRMHGQLEISNNLPFRLKIAPEQYPSSRQRVIEYTYPDPPNALAGFPARIVISSQFEDGLKPTHEILLQSVHVAKRRLSIDYFDADRFKTAAIIHTNFYINSSLMVYGNDGKLYSISNTDGKTVAIPVK